MKNKMISITNSIFFVALSDEVTGKIAPPEHKLNNITLVSSFFSD